MDEVFEKLSWIPSKQTVEEGFIILEKFVSELYSKSLSMSIDEVRLDLFSNSTIENLRKLPPSKDALFHHTLRSAFQAGWVWGNTLKQVQVPSKFDWGWRLHPEKPELLIQWFGSSYNTLLETVISTCKCRSSTAKCTTCKCGKSKIPCLRYCSCKRLCTAQ